MGVVKSHVYNRPIMTNWHHRNTLSRHAETVSERLLPTMANSNARLYFSLKVNIASASNGKKPKSNRSQTDPREATNGNMVVMN